MPPLSWSRNALRAMLDCVERYHPSERPPRIEDLVQAIQDLTEPSEHEHITCGRTAKKIDHLVRNYSLPGKGQSRGKARFRLWKEGLKSLDLTRLNKNCLQGTNLPLYSPQELIELGFCADPESSTMQANKRKRKSSRQQAQDNQAITNLLEDDHTSLENKAADIQILSGNTDAASNLPSPSTPKRIRLVVSAEPPMMVTQAVDLDADTERQASLSKKHDVEVIGSGDSIPDETSEEDYTSISSTQADDTVDDPEYIEAIDLEYDVSEVSDAPADSIMDQQQMSPSARTPSPSSGLPANIEHMKKQQEQWTKPVERPLYLPSSDNASKLAELSNDVQKTVALCLRCCRIDPDGPVDASYLQNESTTSLLQIVLDGNNLFEVGSKLVLQMARKFLPMSTFLQAIVSAAVTEWALKPDPLQDLHSSLHTPGSPFHDYVTQLCAIDTDAKHHRVLHQLQQERATKLLSQDDRLRDRAQELSRKLILSLGPFLAAQPQSFNRLPDRSIERGPYIPLGQQSAYNRPGSGTYALNHDQLLMDRLDDVFGAALRLRLELYENPRCDGLYSFDTPRSGTMFDRIRHIDVERASEESHEYEEFETTTGSKQIYVTLSPGITARVRKGYGVDHDEHELQVARALVYTIPQE